MELYFIVTVRPPASCSDLVEQEGISQSGLYTIFVAGEVSLTLAEPDLVRPR